MRISDWSSDVCSSDLLTRLGFNRALIICTPPQRDLAERINAMLGDRSAGIFDGALMHVPFETVVACRDVELKSLADCTVAIGGGSTTGLAKALALEDGLPIVAVPTTYAGSAMRSEEHTSEIKSLMRISYAVFCLKKNKK